MLLELLKNIEQTVLAKDKVTLMLHLNSFQDFLNLALKNIKLGNSDQTDSQKTIQTICNIQSQNPALIKLTQVLTSTDHVHLLLLHLAMELHEINNTRGSKSGLFRDIIAIETRKSGQYLTAYDLSFLTSMGKISNNSSVLFFQPNLNIMESQYWIIDEKLDFFYMTTAEKKHFKVKRDADGTLIHANTKRALENGKFLYVVSPKGGLYIIDKAFKGLHHSTVRAGQPVLCAGYLTIENGEICEIDNRSGHYTPGIKSLIACCLHLHKQNIINKECVIRASSQSNSFQVQDIITNEQFAKQTPKL